MEQEILLSLDPIESRRSWRITRQASFLERMNVLWTVLKDLPEGVFLLYSQLQIIVGDIRMLVQCFKLQNRMS